MEEEKKTITPEEEINYTTNTTDNESTPEEIDATKITEDTVDIGCLYKTVIVGTDSLK